MTTIPEGDFLKDKRDVNKTKYGKIIKTSCAKSKIDLLQIISQYTEGSIFIMELPSEQYFTENASNIKVLTDAGYKGVYVSFQRPFINVFSLFQRQSINVNQLFFIDVTTACCQGEISAKHPKCVHISASMDITALTQIIYRCLSEMKSKKRFVCIDSLSTMALYKPFSDFVKITELLKQMTRDQGCVDVKVLLNVSEELSRKRFFKEIARHPNEAIPSRIYA